MLWTSSVITTETHNHDIQDKHAWLICAFFFSWLVSQIVISGFRIEMCRHSGIRTGGKGDEGLSFQFPRHGSLVLAAPLVASWVLLPSPSYPPPQSFSPRQCLPNACHCAIINLAPLDVIILNWFGTLGVKAAAFKSTFKSESLPLAKRFVPKYLDG